MKRFIVLCLLAVLTPLMCISAAYGQVETLIINELMASNGDTLRDEDGDSPDWIELYNPTNQVINLGGYGITDSTKKEPWTFPDIQIQPRSYLVIYASGKDRVTKIGSTTHIHTDFSLSIEGEQIFLFNKEGRIIDYVRFPQQYRDVSYGRTESGEWRFFSEPTPGSSNESTPTLGISQKPSVSEDSKVFSEPFYLTLDATEGATIYYAFGGEEPKLSSHVYTEPILIDMTTVIRGMAVEPGKEPSPSFTRTFLYDEDYNISVISIAVEDFLFEDTGIWLNKDARGEEWERPAAVSFFEADGTLGFHYEDDLGIRVHGGASRSYEKSSLRLYWRNQTALEYSLFPNKPELDWFKRIILRCGGQDLIHWDGSLLRCAVFSELWRQIGGLVSSYHPVVVLINEHNWGMYVLRERIDKYYLASNYGVDPDNVDLLKMEMWGILTLKEGDMDEWNRMFRFFETSDFTDPEVYKKATEMIDIANFTDYTIFQIYAGNFDWPHNNIYMFRERTEGAKWRFVMWDQMMLSIFVKILSIITP